MIQMTEFQCLEVLFFWGESVISWFSRKQMVSLSTAEAETHALVDVAKELMYAQELVHSFIEFMWDGEGDMATLYTDNQPAIDAIINGKGRTKHYHLKIMFLAKGVSDGAFSITKVAR